MKPKPIERGEEYFVRAVADFDKDNLRRRAFENCAVEEVVVLGDDHELILPGV